MNTSPCPWHERPLPTLRAEGGDRDQILSVSITKRAITGQESAYPKRTRHRGSGNPWPRRPVHHGLLSPGARTYEECIDVKPLDDRSGMQAQSKLGTQFHSIPGGLCIVGPDTHV